MNGKPVEIKTKSSNQRQSTYDELFVGTRRVASALQINQNNNLNILWSFLEKVRQWSHLVFGTLAIVMRFLDIYLVGMLFRKYLAFDLKMLFWLNCFCIIHWSGTCSSYWDRYSHMIRKIWQNQQLAQLTHITVWTKMRRLKTRRIFLCPQSMQGSIHAACSIRLVRVSVFLQSTNASIKWKPER